MNPNVLKAFSKSGQNVLTSLARSPEDAVHFYDRLQVIRAALRLGVEVLENNMRGEKDEIVLASLKTASMAALGTCTALELAMGTIESLHPELGKARMSTPEKPLPGGNGVNRIRKLDLDT